MRLSARSAEAEELASKLQLRFYRACVKENAMVTDVFEYLAEAHAKAGAQHRKHAAAAAAGGEGGGGAQQIGSLGGAGAGANAQQQQQPAAGAHRADAAAADRGGGAAGGATSSANGTGSKAFRIDRCGAPPACTRHASGPRARRGRAATLWRRPPVRCRSRR